MTSPTGAIFSDCRRYRYVLWRVWDDEKATINFIGLNPSTADETTDDPTMRRCRQFARDWGYGGFLMTNLFAFRATEPAQLKIANDPVGAENDKWISQAAKDADRIIFVWGAHGSFRNRDKEVTMLLGGNAYCLSLTKAGQPGHPLYLKRSLLPVEFPGKRIARVRS